ncbi:MAG: alpha/beta fold hydrolase [Winogradskyella sp.]|nr:alpha/beta fold hydrolase [Winogradskyella sp.]
MILHSNIIGEGKDFVILHGFLGSGDNWKTLASQFAEAGYRVHLVDQRNHGRSFHSDEFNYDIMVEDVHNYFDHHHIENAVLLGHSMGGKTAMFFAASYPELVHKLIIADISPRYYPVHHDKILEGLGQLNFNELKSRSEADKTLGHYVSDFGTRQFLLKNLYWVEKGQLGLRFNLEVLTENVSKVGEALPISTSFNKDTLFLKGDRSEYIGVNDKAIIHRQFPNAKIESITNAGHWLHPENPEEFYAKTITFIQQ